MQNLMRRKTSPAVKDRDGSIMLQACVTLTVKGTFTGKVKNGFNQVPEKSGSKH